MSEIAERLAEVRGRIADACARAARPPGAVRLIGVTKTQPPERVRAAAAAGLQDLGENHVQALAERVAAEASATWHLLGRIQSNKAGRAAELAGWVHALEPGRAARRLGARAVELGRQIPSLLEVDFAVNRVGVPPEAAEDALAEVAALEGIDLRGLMTVAPLEGEPRRAFAALRELRDRLSGRFPALTELSMGMSVDYEDAVGEGATMVRVGTAIFGPRP